MKSTRRRIADWVETAGHPADRGLQQPEAGVAPAVLGVLRDVLPRARRRRRRHDGPGLPEHDLPHRGGDRAGADGHGDHHVHGEGVGRPSEPRGEPGVRGPRRLPVAPGAGLHRRAAARCDPGCAGPAADRRRVGHLRLELPGRRVLVGVRVLDGAAPHVGAGERHPRHGVGRAEPRDHRRLRRRRLHRAGRAVGQPDLGNLDEPGSHVRTRSRRGRLLAATGSTWPDRSPAPRSRSCAGSSCAGQVAAGPDPAPPKESSTPKSPTPRTPD